MQEQEEGAAYLRKQICGVRAKSVFDQNLCRSGVL
jgi:hypothetical protein